MSLAFDKKVGITANTIISLLNASGPQNIGQILAEVKIQAYPAMIAEALRHLVTTGEIYYLHDEQVFEAL